MLETDHQQQVTHLLQTLERKLNTSEVPADFYQQHGILPSFDGDNRRFARKYLRTDAVVKLLPTIPAIPRDGSFEQIVLLDVSRSGLGFYIHQELYPGERVEVLTQVGKFEATVRRCVKRCEHRYEIGAEFD